MKKIGANLLIINLIISLIAFSFIINIASVSAAGKLSASEQAEFDALQQKLHKEALEGTPVPTHGIYGGILEKIGISTQAGTWGFTASGILQGAGWALAVGAMVKMIGGFLGIDSETLNAAATAISWGVFAGMTANTLFGGGGVLNAAWTNLFGPWLAMNPWLIGAGVAIVVFISIFSKTKIKIINFKCNPWDAKTGGSDCEKCNKQGLLTCSEYQCRSLGQACQLLNPGTEDAKCAWVNKNDINPPIIKTNPDALLAGYKYNPDSTISPPDKGVKIINQNSKDGCVNAFTPLKFGIQLNEPAKCKIDYVRKNSFADMDYYFGGSSMFRYNHTQSMALPGKDNLEQENLTIQNNGEFALYTRCQDANGNSNTANFVFKFCVEQGPDTTPPLIVSTNLINGMPIAYNQTSIDLDVYVNEPAECRWSHLDQGYNDMEETMSCSSSVEEMNAQLVYTCSTTLTGLKNKQENKFYFRCKDQPLKTRDRNVNTQSYEFSLIGTQPLIIDEVSPNGTIKDSTDIVKVTFEAQTSAGYNEGEAMCYYSPTGKDYILFYETGSYQHSQELWLASGNYNYSIKCIDLGGNTDTKEVNFNVESDSNAPIIIRAYHDAASLKIVTGEEAECVYDTVDCSYSFEDGTSITTTDGLEHFTDWDTKTNLYIKCKDRYGNEPQPQNTCSIIVRAYNA